MNFFFKYWRGGPTVSEQLFVYFHSIQYIVFQYANSFVVSLLAKILIR